jgi:hypothetical protein
MERNEQILSLGMDSDRVVVVLIFIWGKIYCHFLGHARSENATL